MFALALAAAITWNGVTLGQPASQLRAALGDPLRVLAGKDGTVRAGRYWIAGSDSTFFIVLEEGGYVTALHAFSTDAPASPIQSIPADPSGVRVGDTLERVASLHPGMTKDTAGDGSTIVMAQEGDVKIAYEFSAGRVRSFDWRIAAPNSPALAPLSDPSGDSFATAILDAQKDEMSGVHWEYMYLAFHPCDGDARWKPAQQSLLHDGGRAYDRIHAVCPTTKAERDFYFDITPYFGKI